MSDYTQEQAQQAVDSLVGAFAVIDASMRTIEKLSEMIMKFAEPFKDGPYHDAYLWAEDMVRQLDKNSGLLDEFVIVEGGE